MMNLKKGSALLLVGMMIMSGLVAFLSAPVVSADTTLTGAGSRFTVIFDDALMSDELEYDVDPDLSYYLLGEGDGVKDSAATANTLNIQVQLENNWPPVTAVTLNITDYNSGVFDFEDPDWDTNPHVNSIPWPAVPLVNTTATYTFIFMFDVLKTSGLGAPSDTEIDMRLWYSGAGTGVNGENINYESRIWLSSIFDDPTTPSHEQLPDIIDANPAEGGDVLFEAGDVFEAAKLQLWNYDSTDIDDLECIITPPANSGITLRNNRAWLPNGINSMQAGNLTYRVDVASGTLPGVYPGTAAITYTRDDSDLPIIEPITATVDFRVNYNFYNTNPYPVADTESRDQCYASDVVLLEDDGVAVRQEFPAYERVEIDQSTFSDKTIKIRVNITNNGNVDLQRVTYRLAVNSTLGEWDYFRNPKIYYDESSGPATLNDDISIMFDEHNIGTVVSFNITVIVVKEIPIGEHRLPILYDGYFFDNGTLGDPTNMTTINGGNGLPAFPDSTDMDDLELSFSIWVNDGVMDCYVSGVAGAPADKLDIRSEVITVSIVNMEGYSYIDILVTANFNGTPFYAPLIDTATGQPPVPLARSQIIEAFDANVANVTKNWAVYDETDIPSCTMVVHFRVDTDSTKTPDRYPFTVTITAIIENTLVEVTTTIAAGAEFDFAGYGAVPLITAFTAEDIIPGQAFDLVLTIENVGDDTLRDVWLDIIPDNTVPFPWDIEADFKEQFMWGGDAGYDLSHIFDWTEVHWDTDFPSEMFYTMESLDVDNIREIIEINLYMEGVYSDPGSRIQLIHIIDLAPGASFDVTFEMFADKDMVNGKPYNVMVRMTGLDPEGADVDEVQILEVWSSLPGDSYNPVELDWFDAGLKLLFLVLFFLIVLALLLIIYNKFKGEPSDEDEDDFDFEDDETASFEEPEAPKTETKAPEELVQP